jgi:anti-anti-sigma factor
VPFDGAMLSVEVLTPRLRVVRVAGVLDRVTAARVAALVEAQLALPGCAGHVVVDLGEVGFFGSGDMSVLVRACDAGRCAGVQVHLAGLAARETMLPMSVTSALAQFSVFPTVEQAQSALAGRASVTVDGPQAH